MCFRARMKFLQSLSLALTLMSTSLFAADAPLYSIPLKDIDGKDTSLKAYAGKAVLVVNVASQCGYTRQYTGLEALYQKYKDQGLVVAGFPCNDFGSQEPGTPTQIKAFCSSKFDVTFPLFDKLHVKGAEQHPLYNALTGSTSPFPGPVKWNFGKFLLDEKGNLIAYFPSKVKPMDAEITSKL